MTKRPLIVFDVNETLLDLDSMAPIFECIFGERLAVRLWFDDLIIYSQALTPSQISALGSAGPNATNAQINAIVPEPSSLLVLLGFGTLMGRRRLRRRGA